MRCIHEYGSGPFPQLNFPDLTLNLPYICIISFFFSSSLLGKVKKCGAVSNSGGSDQGERLTPTYSYFRKKKQQELIVPWSDKEKSARKKTETHKKDRDTLQIVRYIQSKSYFTTTSYYGTTYYDEMMYRWIDR